MTVFIRDTNQRWEAGGYNDDVTTEVKNPRDLFRQHMRNLTAGASPQAAIREGLYVPPPGTDGRVTVQLVTGDL